MLALQAGKKNSLLYNYRRRALHSYEEKLVRVAEGSQQGFNRTTHALLKEFAHLYYFETKNLKEDVTGLMNRIPSLQEVLDQAEKEVRLLCK